MTKTLTIAVMMILGLFCLSAQAERGQHQNVELLYNTFKDWTAQHNHQFGIEEMYFRFSNWKNNLDFVREHNAKELPFKLEMNKFAHMSTEEFAALHLGFDANLAALNRQQSADGANEVEAIEDNADSNDLTDSATNGTDADADVNDDLYDDLPASIDWRNKGAVTAVANQGMCGGCWAFSSAEALEGLNAINSTNLLTFSKQQLLDCSTGYGNMGCNGGLMDAAFNYTKDNGIQLEASYPYNATNGTCNYNASEVAFKNGGFKILPGNNSLELKLAVSRQPVSIAIEASSRTLQLFKEGVITTGCGMNLDHGVLVVGYDTMVDGTEYWIVKNSWTSLWGMNGYFNVAMGNQNNGAGVCGMNIYNVFPTL